MQVFLNIQYIYIYIYSERAGNSALSVWLDYIYTYIYIYISDGKSL